jgi:hypothetical protein
VKTEFRPHSALMGRLILTLNRLFPSTASFVELYNRDAVHFCDVWKKPLKVTIMNFVPWIFILRLYLQYITFDTERNKALNMTGTCELRLSILQHTDNLVKKCEELTCMHSSWNLRLARQPNEGTSKTFSCLYKRFQSCRLSVCDRRH